MLILSPSYLPSLQSIKVGKQIICPALSFTVMLKQQDTAAP